MTTEFNLSEKAIISDTPEGFVYDEGDVKEFIRLLKEFARMGKFTEHGQLNLSYFNSEIDKLSGDKLNGKN